MRRESLRISTFSDGGHAFSLVKGPDFEIPPDPPAPPVGAPVQPLRKPGGFHKVRAAVLVVLLGLSGVGAYAWSTVETDRAPLVPFEDPLPSTAATPETRPAPSSSSTVTPTSVPVSSNRTCVDSEGSPGGAREAPSERPPWLTLHFGPRVSTAALVLISSAASEAREAFGDAGAVGVHVYCDIDEYAAALRIPSEEALRRISEGRFASIVVSDIRIYGPSFERQPSVERRRIIYHEYFHAVQHSLSRNRSSRGERLLWLIEGSARYFEYAITERSLAAFRQSEVRRWADLPELATLIDPVGSDTTAGREAYRLGSVASDYLATKYGRALLQHDFWAALAGTDWRSAFLQVFGVSLDEFYADFEIHRATLRP